MSPKKTILLSIGSILLILAGFVLYVTHMDWNSQKDDIAARFSKTSGRKIEFTGNLSVSLFPSPHIEANDVNILNGETSEKLATVATLEASLSLSALLKGVPDIQSMSLVGAEFWWTVDENGVSNWHQSQKSQFLDSDMDTGLQKFNLRNSLVHYQNRKYEIEQEIKQLNAEILAESLVGPYRLDGNFIKNEDHFGIALSIGDVSQGDDVAVNFGLTHPNSHSFILYDGTYNFGSGHLKGDWSGDSKQTADFINTLFGHQILDTEYNRQLLFSVTAEANSKQLTLSSFAVKYTDIIEGSGQIIIPWATAQEPHQTVDVQYQLVSLDINPLYAELKKYIDQLKAGQEKYEPSLPFDVTYNIEAEHIILTEAEGGFIEDVSAKGSFHNGEFDLDDFYAGCPGNIILTMSGSVLAENDLPHYFLKAKFDGKNVLTFLNAFGVKLKAPTQSAFRNIKLAFNVSGNPSQFDINDMKMTLDKTQWNINGNVNIETKPITWQIKAAADKINFDTYLEAPDGELKAITVLKNDFEKMAELRDKNIDLSFSAENMNFRGIPYTGFGFQLKTDGDIIHVIDLKTDDVLGCKARISADITGLGSTEPIFKALEYDFSTANLSPIISKMQLDLPQWGLFKDKNIQSSGTLSGNLQNIDISTNTTINNIKLSYKGNLTNKTVLQFDGEGEIKTTNLSDFLSNIDVDYKKLGNTALNCTGKIKGNAKNWTADDTECLIGAAKYSGNLAVKQTENLQQIIGSIHATEFDLANVISAEQQENKHPAVKQTGSFLAPYVWSKNVIDYTPYKNFIIDINMEADKAYYDNAVFNNLTVHVKNQQNLLELENLSFVYKNADFSGGLQVDYTLTPKINGSLRIGNVRLNNLGGDVYKVTDGNLNLSSSFGSDASSVDAFMKNINGTAEFVIDGMGLNGFNFEAIETDLQKREYAKGLFQVINQNLQSGYTYFDSFKGQMEMKQGNLTFTQAAMENENINVNIGGSANLNEWKMETEWTANLKKRDDMPAFSFKLSGDIIKPTLEVNIENIVRKYDEFWEKEATLKREQIEAEQHEKEQRMAEAQKKVNELAELSTKVQAALIQNKAKTNMKESLIEYDNYLDQLRKIDTQIKEMRNAAQKPNYQHEDIKKIEQNTALLTETVENVDNQILPLYEKDVRIRFADTKNRVQKMKDDNTRFYDEYQKMLQEKFSELRTYKSISYMLNNNELLDMQRNVDQLRDTFWEKCYQFSDMFTRYFGLDQTDEISEATEHLNITVNAIADLEKQMVDLQNAMKTKLDGIIADRKKAYEEEQAQEAAEAARRAAEEEAQRKAEAGDEPEEPEVTDEKQPDKMTPNKFGKAKPTPKSEPEPKEEPKVAKKVPTEPQPTLKPADGIVPVSGASGTITKSYEEIPEYKVPGIGILKPMEDKPLETSGKIIVQ